MNAKPETPKGLDLLRQPFPPNQISKLPKPFKKDAPKGKCKPRREGGDAPDNQDHFCGGFHGLPAVHLDYVGHAAATDRMLDADPSWSWQPFAKTEAGLPLFDQSGGLWINLTICGVTRPGYGHAAAKSYGDPGMREKEVIGDALRNAGMRFGMALDLWHKGDLHLDADEGGQSEGAVSPPPPEAFPSGPANGITEMKALARSLWREIEGCGDTGELNGLLGVAENKALLKQMSELENANHREIWEGDGKDNPGIAGLITRKETEFAQHIADIARS
jgi:hypothetical protein